MKVRITEAHKWHVLGEILEKNPQFEKVSEKYFDKEKPVGSYNQEERKLNEDPVVENQEIEITQEMAPVAESKRDQLPNILLSVALLLIIIGLTMIKF